VFSGLLVFQRDVLEFERFFAVFQVFWSFLRNLSLEKKQNTDSESATKTPLKTHVLQDDKNKCFFLLFVNFYRNVHLKIY
jgi:hypothetical protein